MSTFEIRLPKLLKRCCWKLHHCLTFTIMKTHCFATLAWFTTHILPFCHTYYAPLCLQMSKPILGFQWGMGSQCRHVLTWPYLISSNAASWVHCPTDWLQTCTGPLCFTEGIALLLSLRCPHIASAWPPVKEKQQIINRFMDQNLFANLTHILQSFCRHESPCM